MKLKPTAEQPLSPITMIVLAVLIGIVTGFGALGFRAMIGFVHNVLFFGKFTSAYNANIHSAASSWGIGIIFVPAICALIVSWLTQTFPEIRGSGIPEVMNTIYYKEGKIRPIITLIKSLATSISIGSGGSVGREGPIVQIGATFASTFSQIINTPIQQRIILIAAGAGAGVAATFNAPISGLAFATELFLVSINATTIGIVAIATATATYIAQEFLGSMPSINIPALETSNSYLLHPYILLLFVPLGILAGFASALFIKMIPWIENELTKISKNYYIRHSLGMLCVGIIFYLMMFYTGHYYVSSSGYATIIDVLQNALANPWFLLLLFVGKLLTTSLTIGSGASGGIFSPSLFLGATLGSAFAHILQIFFPELNINPATFALAGMAAVISSSTGAILASIAMSYELTRDYNAILPIIVAVAIASWLRKSICYESIYTSSLLKRGIIVPEGLQAAISSASRAQDIMAKDFQIVSLKNLNQELASIKTQIITIIEDQGKIIGVLKSNYFYKTPTITEENIDEFIDKNYIIVSPATNLVNITQRMQAKEAEIVLVLNKPQEKNMAQLLGTINATDIFHHISKTSKLMT